MSIYAIGSLLPLSSSSRGRRFSRRPCFLVLRIEKTEAESVEAIVEASSRDTGSERAIPIHPDSRWINTPHSRAVSATPTVASTTPGPRMGRISANLVSIPPEKRMIHSASIPIICVISKDWKSITLRPNSIPTPRKSSNAGAPKRYAALPAITAAKSNMAHTNNIFSLIT